MVKAMSSGLKILTIRHFSSTTKELLTFSTTPCGEHLNQLSQMISTWKTLIF